MDMSTGKNRLRMVSEVLILIGSLLYLIAALREARFLGYKMFVENLVGSQSSRVCCSSSSPVIPPLPSFPLSRAPLHHGSCSCSRAA